MEEALQEEETEQYEGPKVDLGWPIVLSVVLHLCLAIFLVGRPQGTATPAVTFLDLKMTDLTAPQPKRTAPPAPPRETPIPEPKPEPARLSETPVPPAPSEPAPQPAAAAEVKPAPVPAPTPVLSQFGMGLVKGSFQSIGEGKTLRDDIKLYYMEMLQRINEKWWLDQRFDKKRIAPVMIHLVVARNGDIVANEIMESSGDPRYDRAVREALAAAGPLPPLPATYHGDFFKAPVKLVPPLNLMSW